MKLLPLASLFALALAALPAHAIEVLDNAKLKPALEGGMPWPIVKKQIASSQCQFDSSMSALSELQQAAKKGNWQEKDVVELLTMIQEVATADNKRLRELVARFLNVVENNVQGDASDEYDTMMRTILKEGKSVVPYLLEGLDQESERKRGGVLHALALIGDNTPAVVSRVKLYLFDRSKPVRRRSAECVNALKGPNTCEELIAMIGARQDKLDGIAMALGYIGDPKALETLTIMLKSSQDSDARVCAAFSLGKLRARTVSSVEALLEGVLDERDDKLRETCAMSLRVLRERRAPSYIMKAFERYTAGRDEIIKHLDMFKTIPVIEFLIEQVENDNPKVKMAANDTLRVMSGENYDSKEEWQTWLEVVRGRPDMIEKADAPRVPDARALTAPGDENRPIPTARQ